MANALRSAEALNRDVVVEGPQLLAPQVFRYHLPELECDDQVNERRTVGHCGVTARGVGAVYLRCGEVNGVSVTRETPGQFGAVEGLGAVGPGQVEVGRRGHP